VDGIRKQIFMRKVDQKESDYD